jgi:hypothetical protein
LRIRQGSEVEPIVPGTDRLDAPALEVTYEKNLRLLPDGGSAEDHPECGNQQRGSIDHKNAFLARKSATFTS